MNEWPNVMKVPQSSCDVAVIIIFVIITEILFIFIIIVIVTDIFIFITVYLVIIVILLFVPQSSTAAPVEEAAQALRVKRQDGGDILNGCDPNTAIGGFLLFPLFRAICAERGFEDHGAYGK